MITILKRPVAIDWCKMPMPFRLDSDRKYTQSSVISVWRLEVANPGFNDGCFVRVEYGNVEVLFNGTTTPGTDIGTDYLVDLGNAAGAAAYFARNYEINRDFTVGVASVTGFTYIIFTARTAGATFNPTVTTNDPDVTFAQVTTGVDATPNPNFAYLLDLYVQKVNSDNVNTEPFEKLPSIIIAPNQGPSEIDLAPELLPYTQPEPPTPLAGFNAPEYMRKQALRFRAKWTEIYGQNVEGQVAIDLIGGVPAINANIAVRGGVRKNIYPWVYEQGNVNIGGGTAFTWAVDNIWLTNLAGIIKRRVSKRQFNWLSILATGLVESAEVKIRYYSDATTFTEDTLFTLAWPSGRTTNDVLPLRIPVGLPTALAITGAPVLPFNKYDVRIIDGNDGSPLYPAVTFFVEPEHANERFLFFENSFGGWESVRFIGGRTNFAEVQGELYTRLTDLFNDVKQVPESGNYSTTLTEEMELNSGPLKNMDEVFFLVELLMSETIYFYNYYDDHNDYFRVTRVADSFQLTQDDNHHYFINLKVRKAWQDKAYGYLPIY
jgi:hypothetical protein